MYVYIYTYIYIYIYMVNTSNVLTEDSVPNSFDIAGFELGVSRLRNAIYFSIIAILSKSHFTVFAI